MLASTRTKEMANTTKTTTNNNVEALRSSQQLEPSIDTDKLSYEIFSILESKFLFDYDNESNKLYFPQNNDVHGDRKSQRGKICVLSVDGGNGLQNIISGKTLSHLEAALKKKSGNTDARIADYFDVAAGTGIGGVFSAMLFASDDRGRPIFSADDTWRFLLSEGFSFCPPRQQKRRGLLDRFFGRNRAGSLSGLAKEKALRKIFNDKMTVKDMLKAVLIPCYDLTSTAPFLFSRADALESESYNFKLWEVCMATSAEPSSFGPVCLNSVDCTKRVVGVDGGLAMSNPTAAAITHVLHNKQEFPFVRGVEDILVISIGAGVIDGGFEYEEVRNWQARDWARPVAGIVAEGSAEIVDHAVAMAFGQARSGNYVRIQANSSSSFARCGADIHWDSTSPSNVKRLIGIADETLKQKNVESILFSGKRIGEQSNAEKIEWFAEQLVLEHERRSSRIPPTVALKQAAASRIS